MFGGTPRTSWCPCITSPAVGSCWKPLSPLTISLSVSWMVMVGSFQTCFDFCNHSPFGFGYFYCWSGIFFSFNSLDGVMVWSRERILRSRIYTQHPLYEVRGHAEGWQSSFYKWMVCLSSSIHPTCITTYGAFHLPCTASIQHWWMVCNIKLRTGALCNNKRQNMTWSLPGETNWKSLSCLSAKTNISS